MRRRTLLTKRELPVLALDLFWLGGHIEIEDIVRTAPLSAAVAQGTLRRT